VWLDFHLLASLLVSSDSSIYPLNAHLSSAVLEREVKILMKSV
jgi:hypothetical protein